MKGYFKGVLCFLLTFVMLSCSKSDINSKKATETGPEVKVSIDEAKKLIDENSELIVLDVRTKEEYDVGHIKNAILMPYDQIEANIKQIEKYKDKPVLVYCRTGRRSTIAVKTLIDNGFSKIYHMYEGIAAWKYNLEK